MSGFEVCRHLREQYPANELPILFLTAKTQVSSLIEGFGLGANDYLTKPFARDELFARIDTQLQLAHMNRACSRFVPHQFLQLLGKRNILELRLGDQVQRRMTVLFSDIRSFTRLSEQMTTEENFRFINSYLSRMGPLVREHGGFIDKYIGDAIMALFERSEEALQCAVAMQQLLGDYNAGRRSAAYEPIQIGIGINSGELMLGTLGETARMESTVISDAVNLAARLESLSKSFGVAIVVSGNRREGLRAHDTFRQRSLGKVRVKGKQDVVAIYDFSMATAPP